MNEEVYTYIYPNNLEAPAALFSWKFRDLVILTVGAVLGLMILVNYRSAVPIASTITYGILTMDLGSESQSLGSYLMKVLIYALNPTEWEYTPSSPNSSSIKVDDHLPQGSFESNELNGSDSELHEYSSDKEAVVNKHGKTLRKSASARKRRMAEIDKAQNDKESRFNTQKLKMICAAVLILTIVGFTGYVLFSMYSSDNAEADIKTEQEGVSVDVSTANEAELSLNYKESTEIAWYSGTVDPLSFIKESSGTVTANPKSIDSTELGSVSVTYTVEDAEGNKKEFVREYNVVDNDIPIIAFTENQVQLYPGTEFDPRANIASVSDRVEGELPYAEETGFGTYTITSDVDIYTEGEYTVSVSAIDSNGNEATDSYTVLVKY